MVENIERVRDYHIAVAKAPHKHTTRSSEGFPAKQTCNDQNPIWTRFFLTLYSLAFGILALSISHRFQYWNTDWPSSLADLNKHKRKPEAPRPHKQAAIDNICDKFSGKSHLVMACGSQASQALALILSSKIRQEKLA